MLDRRGAFAELVERHSEEVMNFRVAWLVRQCLLVAFAGLAETAGTVKGESAAKRLIHSVVSQ
jgi:hypothetical protein